MRSWQHRCDDVITRWLVITATQHENNTHPKMEANNRRQKDDSTSQSYNNVRKKIKKKTHTHKNVIVKTSKHEISLSSRF